MVGALAEGDFPLMRKALEAISGDLDARFCRLSIDDDVNAHNWPPSRRIPFHPLQEASRRASELIDGQSWAE